MKTLLILCLALGGCAPIKQKPMWDWCADTDSRPRMVKCDDFKAKLINQDDHRTIQSDVGIRRTVNVRVVK